MRLEGMVASGLLVSSGGADPHYGFGDEIQAEDIAFSKDDRLAFVALGPANRVAVIGLVFQRPPDPLKSFSDAFRLRKEE